MKLLHERLNDLFYGCLPIGSLPLSDGKSLCLWSYEAKALLDEIERDYITKEQHDAEMKEVIEAQRGGECGSGYSAHHVMKTYAEKSGMPMQKNETITKWLDRWFIKRPRFEDGEPMHLGDMCDFGDHFDADERVKEIFGLHYVNDGSWYVQPLHESRRFFAEFCKRPAPKVLDSDGVEIKVGDTVWLIPGKHCDEFPLYGFSSGVPYVVDDHEPMTQSHKDAGRICISGGVYRYGYPLPNQVTHREPDSLEKLRDDLHHMAERQSAGYGASTRELDGLADRLTSLIERGA